MKRLRFYNEVSLNFVYVRVLRLSMSGWTYLLLHCILLIRVVIRLLVIKLFVQHLLLVKIMIIMKERILLQIFCIDSDTLSPSRPRTHAHSYIRTLTHHTYVSICLYFCTCLCLSVFKTEVLLSYSLLLHTCKDRIIFNIFKICLSLSSTMNMS